VLLLVVLVLVVVQGAGAPQDHFIIPPIFLGFADAYVYLRDNKQFEDEVHKILAKTVRCRGAGKGCRAGCGGGGGDGWGAGCSSWDRGDSEG
jgi:hypothetical protein